MSVPRSPLSPNPSSSSSSFHCFFLGLFVCFCFPFYILSSLRAICLPSVSAVTLQTVFVKYGGRSQRISIYLTPACPSSSSHSLIYHTQVLFIVVWQPALGPWLYLSPSAPLIITVSLSLLGISQHICISSSVMSFVVACKATLNLTARILSDNVMKELYDQVKGMQKERSVIKYIV